MLADDGLEILDTAECLALAATRPVGRVAVTVGALPAVFPVNHCLVDGEVYFRTGAGTKLAAATRNAAVAFEVDDFDTFEHSGWSVLIIGRSSEVAGDDLAALEPLRVRPWAHGGRTHVIRIAADFVSGRRIALVGP